MTPNYERTHRRAEVVEVRDWWMMASLFKVKTAPSFGCPSACLAQDRIEWLSESRILDSDMEPTNFGSCEVLDELQRITEHIVFLHETKCLLY